MSDDVNTRTLTFAAADQFLIERGEVPTVRDIREKIQRGSMTTIGSALKEWKTQLGQRLSVAETTPGLPPVLAEAIVVAWRSATEAHIQQAHTALDNYRREADQKVVAVNEKAELVRTELQSVQRHADAISTARDQLAQRIRELENAVQRQTERTQTAQQRADEFRLSLERTIATAEEKHQALKAQLAVAETRYDAMERRLVSELEQVKKHRDELAKQHAKTQAAFDANQLKLSEALQQAAQHGARATTLYETLTKSEHQLQSIQYDLDRLRERESQARARIGELQRHAEQQRIASDNEKSDMRREIEQLKHALMAATTATVNTSSTAKSTKPDKSKVDRKKR